MDKNMKLEELDFSVRTWKCLRKAGIDTLGDLAEKSVDDLLAISNMGRKSLAEIADKLQELGLVLEGYNPDAGKVVYEREHGEGFVVFPEVDELVVRMAHLAGELEACQKIVSMDWDDLCVAIKDAIKEYYDKPSEINPFQVEDVAERVFMDRFGAPLQYTTLAGVSAPQSWDELFEMLPIPRNRMSFAEEQQFLEGCYHLYELEGFSPRFWSPYDQYADRVGQKFEIISRCFAGKDFDLETLPMYKVRFEDGHEAAVFPEEVVPSAMDAIGCEWFKDVLEYDGGMAEQVSGLPVDVMSPQEVADTTGKAVKDGNKYYLPKDIVPGVDNIIQNAEERTVPPASEGKDKDLEIG